MRGTLGVNEGLGTLEAVIEAWGISGGLGSVLGEVVADSSLCSLVDESDIELVSPADPMGHKGGFVGHLHLMSHGLDGGDELAWQHRDGCSACLVIEADDDVEVNDTSSLELNHLDIGEPEAGIEVFDREAKGSGELAAQGNGASLPEFAGQGIKEDRALVVITILTDRCPDAFVVLSVAYGTAKGATVSTESRGLMTGSAVLDGPMHSAKAWCGEGDKG